MSGSRLPAIIIITIALIFSSGCIHSMYKIDLFAAKITPEGKLVWVQVIDSGENDVGLNFTEMSDGSYLIQGGSFTPFCGSSSSNYIRPYEIHISPQGKVQSIVNNSETSIFYKYGFGSFRMGFPNNSLSTLEDNDGSHLATYQKSKLGAQYFRIQKTDESGKLLWDIPFLTLKDSAPPKDIWDAIYVHGIIPTSDKGYIVWGHREVSTSC
jgi:hypothetical protein